MIPRVVVANLSAPEVTRLAAELASRGALAGYVRPYTNKHRGWERALERAPVLGRFYGRTLGRRLPPDGLPLDQIQEAGVMEDFALAMAGRLPVLSDLHRRRLIQGLSFRAERAVAERAARLAPQADVVIASYGTGVEAFRTIKRRGGRAILNYPIAHNDYQRRIYAEEAQLAPRFARALPNLDASPREYAARLDEECHEADRILVGSSFVLRSFVAQGYDARRISVVPYGVDARRFSPRNGERRETFRVLFVGQIGQRKGVSYLFEAYEMFRRADTELHLVGSFVPGAEVYEPYRALFRHTPHVPQSELPEIYRNADVLVFPTLIEGMPLSVLEAMASGLPVIVTPQGTEEIVTDGVEGFIVPIRDARSIAARLEQLYADRALLEHMGQCARRRAEQHTWDRYAARAADIAMGTAQ